MWLDFHTDSNGRAGAASAHQWSFDPGRAPQSLIIHAETTKTELVQAGQAGQDFLGTPSILCWVVFPLGLYSTAVLFDVIRLVTDRAGFAQAAGYTMGIGVIGGVLAGVIGLLDWFAIPKGTRARKVGLVHGVGNVAVNVLFGVSWLLRMNADDRVPGAAALICSFTGLALAGFTGWLGGELVERLGVSVDEDANVNARSSLV